MGSDQHKDQVLSKIQRWLAEQRLHHQICIDRITALEKELASPSIGPLCTDTSTTGAGESEKVIIANGHCLSAEKFADLNEDTYDLILDLTVDTLRFRRDPEGHSELLTSELEDLTNVGPFRIKLLTYMLEHPGMYVSTENAAMCHGASDVIITFTALRTTIRCLRQALGTPGPNNPYIKTKRSISPCAYALNHRWSYLLIKWKP